MQENGEFLSKLHSQRPPRPPAVGTMGTLGGPNGEIFFFKKLGSGRFFPPRLKHARSRRKLKSRSRFLEVGGINLHSVSFCRASFIHDAMIREAGCPAFSIIIGRSLWSHDSVCTGVNQCALLDGPPAAAGAPRYVVSILGNGTNFSGAWRSVLRTKYS